MRGKNVHRLRIAGVTSLAYANAMTAPLYLARHAETVYNAGARMQGHMAHTPLTHAGIAQAHSMGDALRAHFGAKPDIDLWASPSGRTLQTMAVVAEHLGRDFFDVRKGSVAKIVKLEHAWRRLDGRNDDGFQVAPFPG